MKIYIAGAIKNNPDYQQQFAEAERLLSEDGHVVINPAKNPGSSYKEYIDIGLFELMRCEAICLLPGWENSAGANLDRHYAEVAGLKLLFFREEKRTLEQSHPDRQIGCCS